MKAFIHEGSSLLIKAPYEVNSGDGLLIGGLFGVAKSWADEGENVEVAVAGVFELRKSESESWAVGDRIFWDCEERVLTRDESRGCMVGVAVENIGGQGAPTGRIKIMGVAI